MHRFMWPLHLYRVAGESMLPTYKPNDTLLGWHWFRPRVGQVVVARRGRPLIKRITKIEPGRVWLQGDNLVGSTDSRHFGPVARTQVEAVIIARL